MSDLDIDRILMRFAREKYDAITQETRFVHYTSAEAAIKIIQSKELWMRNASCMNDLSEVQYGLRSWNDCYFNSPEGEYFRKVLDAAYPAFTNNFNRYVVDWSPSIYTRTFISCLSQHDPAEDIHGRLSMWRAYGGSAGVALVLNLGKVIESGNDALKAYTSPVAYLNDENFRREIATIAQSVQENLDSLRASVPFDQFFNHMFRTFLFAATCTKHEGFKEELEWRVVHAPDIFPSEVVLGSVETINSIPQTVYKLPLKNDPGRGIAGISITDLVDSVIIGPTQFPIALHDAFARELEAAGVKSASSKVKTSGIPLR